MKQILVIFVILGLVGCGNGSGEYHQITTKQPQETNVIWQKQIMYNGAFAYFVTMFEANGKRYISNSKGGIIEVKD